KFFVPRRIDDGVTASRRSKRNLSSIDGDVLLLFLQKRIEQKREFKLRTLGRAGLLDFFDLAFRKRTSVVQNATYQRGLTVIDMTYENDVELRLNVRSEERRVGKECRSRWSLCH